MPHRRACRRAISKTEWLESQARQLACWGGGDVLDAARERLRARYLDRLRSWLPPLDEESEIIEIGCGPACLSREIGPGHKTLVDPLLDDIRRRFPGALPEDAAYINCAAESIPLPGRCADLILCINTLSFTQNPEIVLHEIARLLKPEGVVLLSVLVCAPLVARLHYLARRLLPPLRRRLRPYRFSRVAMEHTIARHLRIDRVAPVVERRGWWLSPADDELLILCGPREDGGR
ncbi:MAG: class I SAM-dependent methyltransferase [Zetaproteobacteria bacterium]|nr:MAG: class I SAM-dependent methyltransferase [Zetaproteobacteria bacterium]